MKFSPLLFVSLLATFSLAASQDHARIGSVSGTDSSNDAAAKVTVLRNLQTENVGDDFESDPWDNETEVYKVFDDGPFWGTITGYENGMYTVVWSDGDEEQYTVDDTDAMVDAADAQTDFPTEEDTETSAPTEDGTEDGTYEELIGDELEDDPWPAGTEVYKVFDDGPFWGEITGYQGGFYTVEWSDGDQEQYNIDDTDALVDAAEEQDEGTDAPTEEDTDEGTYEDTDADTDAPTMDDTDNDDDGYGDEYEDDPWPVGTEVYKVFDEGPFFGRITGYEDGQYSVRWSDGDVEYYSVPDTDQYVDAAEAQAAAGSKQASNAGIGVPSLSLDEEGMKRGGVAALVSFFVIIAVYCCCKRCRNKKQEREFDSNDIPDPCYMDDPETELEMSEKRGDPLPKFD
eukprot:CAMPEP_0176006048 /NCGR_PEP_ID=MMETSP0120_2-20121206/2521_1 /TAXON_ID=160619 /ORGANISM="Kryptoperidinium foliaceum, Strain CCMP 1326" /LENGTH=399 /DNA_ID=CAMNT_0017338775 /DNA_START=136 /DNA_END=1335 /DNA_ORIENTATION=-